MLVLPHRYRLASFAVVAGLVACTLGWMFAPAPDSQLHTYAGAVLEILDAEQRSAALVPYDSEQRVDWHFIPKKTRKGLVLSEMNSAQRTATYRLMRQALSEAGYGKAAKIVALEGVLREMEGDDRTWARDPQMYYLTIFGEPSETAPWGFSFEGHHLSLNFSCRDGKLVDSTPQFMGANPAILKSDVEAGFDKGTRVLYDEEVLAFELVQSLSSGQKSVAIIDEKAPKEIRFTGEAQPSVDSPEGIPFTELSAQQQSVLKRLVHTYTDIANEATAEARRNLIDDNGWSEIHFAWAGALEPGIGHYYRIRGKEFLIEFVNTQPDPAGNPANHIHAVLRDLSGDFDLEIPRE